MSIKVSIYDFFAYTIPGGLYVLLIAYACSIFGLLQIDWLKLDLSAAQIIIAVGLAYIAGLILDPVAGLWYCLFKPKNLREVAFQEFQKRYSSLKTNIRSEHWPMLLAYIRRESIDLATDIDRSSALNIMLRNISLGFMALALIQVVQFARTLRFPHLILCVALVGFSTIAIKESLKFGKWFFVSIFEATACRSLQQSSLVVSKEKSSRKEAAHPTEGHRRKAVPVRPETAASEGQAPQTGDVDAGGVGGDA